MTEWFPEQPARDMFRYLADTDGTKAKEATDFYVEKLFGEMREILAHPHRLARYVAWLNEWTLESPENRVSAFEITTAMARIVTFMSTHHDNEQYAPTIYDSISTKLDGDELYGDEEGFWDAAAITCSSGNPFIQPVDGRWLWYLTSECSQRRFMSLMVALLVCALGMFRAFAEDENRDSVSLWDETFC